MQQAQAATEILTEHKENHVHGEDCQILEYPNKCGHYSCRFSELDWRRF